MKAVIAVTLKPDVLDPQGKAIKNASASLGYDAVASVRQGKLFEVDLDAGFREVCGHLGGLAVDLPPDQFDEIVTTEEEADRYLRPE